MNQNAPEGGKAKDLATMWVGCNNKLPADKLPPGLVADAVNVRFRTGDIETRHGVVKPGWCNTWLAGVARPATILHGAGVFADPASREWTLIAADGQIYAAAPYNVRQALALPTGVQVRSRCAFVQAFNQMYCFRGRYLAPLVLRTWANGFEDVLPHFDADKTYRAAVLPEERSADEMAYGPYLNILTMTAQGNLVTVTTQAPHGYVTGADIEIRGAVQTEFNGRVNITVVDDTTFTYQFAGSSSAAANRVTISTLTVAGTTATVTTSAAHGLTSGQQVYIEGVTPDAYNGIFSIVVTNSTHFTYSLRGVPVSTGAAQMYAQLLGDTDPVEVSSMAFNPVTGICVVTTASPHGWMGDILPILSGAWPAAFNSTNNFWSGELATVTSATTFVFAPTTAPATTTAAAAMVWQRVAGNFSSSGKITSLIVTGTTAVATLETALPAYVLSGQRLWLAGIAPLEFGGWQTITRLSPTSFSYDLNATPGTSGSGTMYATVQTLAGSNMGDYWAALGDRLALDTGSLTSVGLTATVNYTAHGVSVGDWVTISGAEQPAYNGIFQVQTVASANTFTYNLEDAATPATGLIYVYKPTVTAGRTPESNPECWRKIYNVLPNADDAVFINGRLLVPTAFTPGDTGYDSTSSWTKKDYIIAMDVLDPVHFRFTNGFRINQGDDSEITNIVKYDQNTAIVTKGKRWGILSNLQMGDYSQITFDLHPGHYGCPTVGSAVAWGKDVFWPSAGRGLVSLKQTTNGILQGQDIPLSDAIEGYVKRINWASNLQRVAIWDDVLYWAVALDSSATNNALLVYDFRTAAWAGRDTLAVKEFFASTIDGRERLLTLDFEGWVNLLAEAIGGDQVGDPTSANGLSYTPMATEVLIPGNLFGVAGQKKFPQLELGLGVWNAQVTVTLTSGGQRSVRATSLTDKTFSRTRYLKPWDKPPWDASNVNRDWAEPNRGDYSVTLNSGVILQDMIPLAYQELFLRPSSKTFRASYPLIRIVNHRGRLKVKQIAPVAQEGEQRYGVMI